MKVARWHTWIENAYRSTRAEQIHLRRAAMMLWEPVCQKQDQERHAGTGGKVMAARGTGVIFHSRAELNFQPRCTTYVDYYDRS
jgi:hypothetical protein